VNYFLDTSAVVKLYHREQGTSHLETYLEQAGEDLFLVIAGITPLEFRSAFYRRVRTEELKAETLEDILQRFNHDLQYIESITVSPFVMREAIDLMDTVAATQELRTLDAIQLASALVQHQSMPIDTFIAADTRLLKVASHYFTTFNPMTPE